MAICTILVINNAPGCDNPIAQQFTGNCDTYIVRLSSNSNALGPFDVYLDSVLIESGLTRTEMFNGIVVTCGCPTPTPTPTITSTPIVSPSQTPTQTPTPSGSPTQTPTQTGTPTPTPTSTLSNFQILLITQDGIELITQDGNSLLMEQQVSSFLVSAGSVGCPSPATLTQTIYSPTSNWSNVVRFFSDPGLTTPFNGGGLNYTNNTVCGDCWVIDNNGYTSNLNNPC